MILELLYLPGCPNHDRTVTLVRSVLRQEGLNTDVEEIPVNDYEEARARRFPGSPTVRVNGEDVESVPAHRLGVGIACRMYFVEGEAQGVPPRSWIERAIRAAGKPEGCR
ncbi:MAG TPA: hypothetical protein VGI45_05365 [Terracidiphilus sp.]|jgi:hypothetical protein